MYFVEQVADKFMRWRGEGDSISANPGMLLDDTGNWAFASFRGSPTDLEAATFARMGDLIDSEMCSWNCDKAIEWLELERSMDKQYAIARMCQTLEGDLGRISLRAMCSARDRTSLFVVSFGTGEAHVEMSLKPLNSHIRGNDAFILNLKVHLAKVTERVKDVWRCGTTPNANASVPSTKGQSNE